MREKLVMNFAQLELIPYTDVLSNQPQGAITFTSGDLNKLLDGESIINLSYFKLHYLAYHFT